jgi:hypothetical protein
MNELKELDVIFLQQEIQKNGALWEMIVFKSDSTYLAIVTFRALYIDLSRNDITISYKFWD